LVFTVAAFAKPEFPLINSTQPLTIDSLVQIGFYYNSTVRTVQQDLRLNKIAKLNAVGQFLPTLDVGGSLSESHFKTTTFVKDDGTVGSYPIIQDSIRIDGPEGESRSSSQFVGADLLLFDGLKRFYLYKMAKNQEKINDLSVHDAKKALQRSVAAQAVLVLTQQKLVDLSKKLRDQRQDAYDLAKARFEVGAVTELDVLQAQIELGTADNNIKQSERDLASARETLNQTLGIDLRSDYPIAETAGAAPTAYTIDDLIQSAYQYRTDLAIADLTADQSRLNLLHAKQDYLPTASLGATWSKNEQSGSTEPWTLSPRNRNATYSLSVRWNLFDGFSRELTIASRRIERDKSYEQARQLRLGLEKDVRKAYYDLENSAAQLQTTEKNRGFAQRTLDLERERYRLGATSQLALRDAQVTYARAETDHLAKQFEVQSNLIALELAVGKSLR
jgi:outer membrane protein TolC